MESKIRFLTLDVGGVLFLKNPKKKDKSFFEGVHAGVIKKLKISLDKYLDSIDTAYAKSIIGDLNFKEVLNKISSNLGVSPKILEAIYFSQYKKYFQLNKELIEKLLNFKKKGYKLAILSDQWPVSKKFFIKKEFYKIFDVVLVSCDVGLRKPSLKIYKLLKKKLGVKYSQILFIDNRKWNLPNAERLGIRTILFKNNKKLFLNLKNLE